MNAETPAAEVAATKAEETPSSATITIAALTPSDAMVAIGNDVLANEPSGTMTPTSASMTDDEKDDAESDVFQDAMDEDLPITKKLNNRLSQYLPQTRQSEEWTQIMQDWERVMAEKRIQDARLNLVEQENKRMKTQLLEADSTKANSEKELLEKIASLEKENKELSSKVKDPAKETRALKDQLEESEAEKELFKLMLEETEGEKKRVEVKFAQLEKEKETWKKKTDKIHAIKNRLKLKSAEFQLLSTSTSLLLAQGLNGTRPDKERKRLMDQVSTLESDRSRLAAMVKDTMNSSNTDSNSDDAVVDVSTLSTEELVKENKKLANELEMAKVEYSLLQSRIEAFEVTLHDVRVALTNSEAHAESLEMKKYDLQDKLAASEGNLDRARIESAKYQGLHKEMLEKNDKLDRELQVIKARFDAKDRVLVTTQKQLDAAKADGGLLKTIRRELESVLFDYNTVVQHFMDIQVQAIGAKSLANTLKRKNNELNAQLTHYRSMLLGIKSFNNNDPIKTPTVTTLRAEFRDLMEKLQAEQTAQVDKERADKAKTQDWNRKLRMEKDFMRLELQNQIEKWKRVSVYWEDKWRKTANELHEAVTTGTTSEVLFELASGNPAGPPSANSTTPTSATATSPRVSQSFSNSVAHAKRRSLAILTSGISSPAAQSPEQPMTPSAMKQQIMESKLRSTAAGGPQGTHSRQTSLSFFNSSSTLSGTPVTAIASPPVPPSNAPSTATLAVGAITESITDLVSTVKPYLSRSISHTGTGVSAVSATTSSLVGGVGTGRPSPSNPSSRLAASASLRTPIAAGLPPSMQGVGAMGNTAVSKTSLRSRSAATNAIGTARSQALQAGSSTVTPASRDAQTRASASISTMARSVDQTLSESEKLKADVRRMLSR